MAKNLEGMIFSTVNNTDAPPSFILLQRSCRGDLVPPRPFQQIKKKITRFTQLNLNSNSKFCINSPGDVEVM